MASIPEAEALLTRKFYDVNGLLLVLERVDGDFQVFTDVREDAYTRIVKERDSQGRKIRFWYLAELELLCVTVPTAPHEKAHGDLYTAFVVQMAKTSPSLEEEWTYSGATRYNGNGPSASSKEGDSGGYPITRPDSEWPTLVIESGVSQSLNSLRQVMQWWFAESKHEVKIVVLVKVYRRSREIHIEKYTEEVLRRSGAATTRSFLTHAQVVPILRQSIKIEEVAGNPVSYNVTSGALVLEFDLLFLRLADVARGEGDVTVSVEALKMVARKVMRVL